jgi:membrane protease YdiL (CAAX protease family)
MRTDISTSDPAAVSNKRMLADAADPAGIPAATLGRLVVFLGVTLTTTWLAFLPIIIGFVERTSVAGWSLLVLGAGAPSITAFALSAACDGWAGVRRLARAGTRWRVNIGWYLAILAIPGLASGGSWAVGAATGVSTAFNPLVPALISGLLAGLLEEFGWSGLVFPALQARFGFLGAGAAVGVIVAVWHLPFFLLPGTTQNASSFVMFLVILVAVRIVYGWVYNGSGGSVLLAILLHASGNTWSEVLHQPPAATTASAAAWTQTGVFAITALVAVWTSRRRATRMEEHRPADAQVGA